MAGKVCGPARGSSIFRAIQEKTLEIRGLEGRREHFSINTVKSSDYILAIAARFGDGRDATKTTKTIFFPDKQ